jgi:hypothetical protein
MLRGFVHMRPYEGKWVHEARAWCKRDALPLRQAPSLPRNVRESMPFDNAEDFLQAARGHRDRG